MLYKFCIFTQDDLYSYKYISFNYTYDKYTNIIDFINYVKNTLRTKNGISCDIEIFYDIEIFCDKWREFKYASRLKRDSLNLIMLYPRKNIPYINKNKSILGSCKHIHFDNIYDTYDSLNIINNSNYEHRSKWCGGHIRFI